MAFEEPAYEVAKTMRYDPPWTLWFLRRNEVHLPVRPADAGAAAPRSG